MKSFLTKSLSRKVALNLLIVAIAGVIFINLFLPNILYSAMKEQITGSMGRLINANAIRQSFIWQKRNNTYEVRNSTEISDLIEQFYQTEDASLRADIRTRMAEKLPIEQVGMRTTSSSMFFTAYIIVITEEGDFFCIDEAKNRAQLIVDSGWLKQLDTTASKQFFSPAILNNNSSDFAGLFAYTIPFTAGDIPCFAICSVDIPYLTAQFEQLQRALVTDYAIIHRGQTLYASSDYAFDPASLPFNAGNTVQYEPQFIETEDGMLYFVRVSYSSEDYCTVYFVDKDALIAPYLVPFIAIESIFYALIAALFVFIYPMIRHMLKRLIRLNRTMETVRDGHYDVVIHDDSADEIGQLTRTFNRMTSRIQNDIAAREASQQKEQRMQYSLMVSAIDPHFIYNTLSTITFLAKMGKTDEIVDVNRALIGTLRDRLDIKNCKTFDTVQNEKDALDRYMFVQSYLSHIHITYSFINEVADPNIKIPKAILQPLVENSIKHGLSPHKDPKTMRSVDGIIEVKVVQQDNRLIITVIDNGIGLSQEEMDAYFTRELSAVTEEEVHHVGVYNIRTRLAYLFGNAFSLTAQSKNGHTTITLILPTVT